MGLDSDKSDRVGSRPSTYYFGRFATMPLYFSSCSVESVTFLSSSFVLGSLLSRQHVELGWAGPVLVLLRSMLDTLQQCHSI